MKKIIPLLLATMMAFALVACGGSSEPKEAEKQPAASTSTAVASSADNASGSTAASSAEQSAEPSDSSAQASQSEQVGGSDVDTKEPHLYDVAVVKPMMNGTRTEKLGEYSVIEADSSQCTEKALADWYLNYVEKNDFNYSLIVYTDKSEEYGCYAANGLMQEGVGIETDENGDYSLGESSDATTYVPSDDGKTLEKIG